MNLEWIKYWYSTRFTLGENEVLAPPLPFSVSLSWAMGEFAKMHAKIEDQWSPKLHQTNHACASRVARIWVSRKVTELGT